MPVGCLLYQSTLPHTYAPRLLAYRLYVRVHVCVYVSWLRRFGFIGVRGIYMVICCTAGFTARQ